MDSVHKQTETLEIFVKAPPYKKKKKEKLKKW
jgi:hypothetical protein